MTLALVMIAGFGTAGACSCMPRGTTEQEVGKAAFVAKAKLFDVDTVSVVSYTKLKRGLAFWKPRREYFFQPMVRAKFVVGKVYKGPGAASDTIYVLTNVSSAACGYHFSLGESGTAGEYLVYASATGDYTVGVTKTPGKVPGRKSMEGNAYYTTGLCMATQPASKAEEEKLDKLPALK